VCYLWGRALVDGAARWNGSIFPMQCIGETPVHKINFANGSNPSNRQCGLDQRLPVESEARRDCRQHVLRRCLPGSWLPEAVTDEPHSA
jgi:hypothetical protein